MKTRSFLFLLSISIFLGCAKEPTNTVQSEPEDVALVQAADGQLYFAECLKDKGFSNLSACEFDSNIDRGVKEGVRGYVASETYYSPYYNYYVYNPYQFNQSPTQFSNYWNWPSNWFLYLGYGSNCSGTSNNANTCGQCFSYYRPSQCMRRYACSYYFY